MPRQTADDEDFDPYHKWLGIPKDQRPPTLYQILGISPNEEDDEAIEAAAARQKLFIQEFQKGPRGRTATSILFQIEEAKVTLLNPTMRDAYDQRLGIRRDYRRTYKGTSAGASDFGSGSNSVAESGGFLKDYAKFVLVLTAAFLVMAISSFYLPWSKLAGGRRETGVERDRNTAQIQQANQQKPVEQKIETPKQVANVEEKKTAAPKPSTAKKAEVSWIDLIDESTINKVRSHGDWRFSNGVLSLKGNPRFSAVHYPILLADNYELDVEFNRLGDGGTPLSLPVGHSRIRLVFYDDWIEISRVHNERNRHTGGLVEGGEGITITTNGIRVGRYHFSREEYGVGKFPDGFPIRIPSGTHMNANILVSIDGKNADVAISLNGKLALSWNGELKNLSECKEGDFYEGQSRQGLVVGTFQGGSNQFTKLRYRIVDNRNSATGDKPPLASPVTSENSETAPIKLPDTPHHKTALWILQEQGQLDVTSLSTSGEMGRVNTIFRKEQLPSQDFRITKINLYRRPIEDSHMRRLAEQSIDNVVELNLMETKVSDVGLLHVAKFKNLRSLNIAATKVNGTGFRYLTEMRYLRELFCGGAPIQDSSLRYLKDFPSLSILGLIDTKVTDEGTVDLSQVSTLTELRMNGTKLTDRGLANLLTLKGLKILSVSNTKVSQKAINAIRKRNPSCVVNW